MANYRLESVQESLDELEGKYRDTLSGADWVSVTDSTYGSCYRATVIHNLAPTESDHNITFWSVNTAEQIMPMGCRLIDVSSFYVFMPINTQVIRVIVN